MRTRALLLALVLAAGAAAVALLARSDRHGAGGSAPPAGELLLVGDSLNVGVEPYLREALRGWTIRTDDEVGRPTSLGLDHLRSDAGAGLPPYLVISLGTNDSSAATAAFRSAVRRAVALAGPRRCVVWPTIHRDGNAYAGFNAVLREEARRAPSLRVVDWESIANGAGALAPDGIHGSPAGYRARATAIVAALGECHAAGIVG